eukprot:CAMPEP_0169481414 /NCGR_PEP_ID=MMETSP1042-20121227/30104_1 /TAXON_ID=464988 /ORGANISM="Hemiselmis andersenii, Strain CCMP1180" /LENGTH=202 /DNA_ID=CAMNT_0009596163 /DNA_START=342 /DNA_END=947 /DNA_ORIENTATION=-
MAVRISGTMASFDAIKRLRFLTAVKRASLSAQNVSITSVTEVSVGRRRLLATFLDIGLQLLYPDLASASLAVSNDLTESSLSEQMQAENLGTLTVTAQPTISSQPSSPGSQETSPQPTPSSTPSGPPASTPADSGGGVSEGVIVAAIAGGVLVFGGLVYWLVRQGRRNEGLEGDPLVRASDPPGMTAIPIGDACALMRVDTS